jgi:hypothetical protein
MDDDLAVQQKQRDEERQRLLREAADDLHAAVKQGEQTRADWLAHQERIKQAIVDGDRRLHVIKRARLRAYPIDTTKSA